MKSEIRLIPRKGRKIKTQKAQRINHESLAYLAEPLHTLRLKR